MLSGSVRAVAVFEAAKGLLVLLAGMGALSSVHQDIQGLAERLVAHLHLNPAGAYPRIFLDFAAGLTDARLGALAALAAGYASVRFIEAYGLWHGRRWAELLAAVSGGVYIPFELFGIARGDTWFSLAALAVNVAVVALMIAALRSGPATRRKGDHQSRVSTGN